MHVVAGLQATHVLASFLGPTGTTLVIPDIYTILHIMVTTLQVPLLPKVSCAG